MAGMPGGSTDMRDATVDIQSICDQVKPDVEKSTNKTHEIFTAVAYISQVVAGTIFFIRVYVGGDRYLHLKVLRRLPFKGGENKLLGFQEDRSKDDALVPF